MGSSFQAVCRACGQQVQVHQGCSMLQELFHCDRCGAEKWLDLARIWQEQRRRFPQTPPNQQQKDHLAEELAGSCGCNGRFTLNAPARCPKCLSTDLANDGSDFLCYD